MTSAKLVLHFHVESLLVLSEIVLVVQTIQLASPPGPGKPRSRVLAR